MVRNSYHDPRDGSSPPPRPNGLIYEKGDFHRRPRGSASGPLAALRERLFQQLDDRLLHRRPAVDRLDLHPVPQLPRHPGRDRHLPLPQLKRHAQTLPIPSTVVKYLLHIFHFLGIIPLSHQRRRTLIDRHEAPPSSRSARRPCVLDRYLESLPSPASQRTMATALRAVAQLVSSGELEASQVRWWELTPSDVARVRAALCTARTARSTGRLRLSALRGILRECWRAGLLDSDRYHRLVDVRPVPGAAAGRGRIVSPGEIRALFRVCTNSPRGHRDRAMLALLFGLGARRSELVRLQVSDVDLETGRVSLQGKGGRDRIEYLTTSGLRHLSSWLVIRGTTGRSFLTPVVQSRVVNRPISAQTVYDSTRRLARQAGVEPFSPHDARRTFISRLLSAGVDLVTVARAVGHASVATTSIYDKRGEDAVRAASAHILLDGEGDER